jgi:hypothetical protein
MILSKYKTEQHPTVTKLMPFTIDFKESFNGRRGNQHHVLKLDLLRDKHLFREGRNGITTEEEEKRLQTEKKQHFHMLATCTGNGQIFSPCPNTVTVSSKYHLNTVTVRSKSGSRRQSQYCITVTVTVTVF